MIVKHKFQFIHIQFTSIDWDNGTAKEVIAYLKSLPKGCKSYLPNVKEWRLDKKKAPPEALQEIFRINNEKIVASKKIEAEENIDDFDAVFGIKETI